MVDLTLVHNSKNLRKKKICPSLLSADFGRLTESALLVEKAGADSLHMDIVDGHFGQTFGFAPESVIAVRKAVKLPINVHLEIENPDRFIDLFSKAGASTILFHPVTTKDPAETIKHICSNGCQAGLAFGISEPVTLYEEIFPKVSSILILGVPPGFGGALMDPSVINMLSITSKILNDCNCELDIEVDGGVNIFNAKKLSEAGATVFVCGSYIFNGDPESQIDALRREIEISN